MGVRVLGSQQLTLTLAEATRSRPIAEDTIERLGLPTTPDVFLERLEAEPIENTQFINRHTPMRIPKGRGW